MKKMLALFVVLFVVLCSSVVAFAQDNGAVVRWKTIVGNITVSNNDAVGGINPGTTPWSTLGGSARVNLSTGHVSFDVKGNMPGRKIDASASAERAPRSGPWVDSPDRIVIGNGDIADDCFPSNDCAVVLGKCHN